MRIAYVISTLQQCGPVNVLFDIASVVAKSNEVKVFTLAAEPSESRIAEFRRLGIEVECVTRGRVESMLRGRKLLQSALDKFSPDLVHAHAFRAYLLCQSAAYPLVATIHNCIFDDFRTTYSYLQAQWMTFSEVRALRRFDLVIACSESNARVLREEYKLNVCSVRNGVNREKYHPLSFEEKEALRDDLAINEHVRRVFVSTGGCSERKGTADLIELFQSDPTCSQLDELHIFGEGPDFERCKAIAGKNVFLHGYCSDVAPWLQAADIFVSNSSSEGMPLAVLEAICCGCKAVLSDIPPHREIAECSFGSCGIASNKEDFFSLYPDSLLEGLETDTACFGSEVMAREYLEAYLRVLRGIGA